ncbi:hypothetical protein LCGC14_2974790, partial [marine sediment metagenome]
GARVVIGRDRKVPTTFEGLKVQTILEEARRQGLGPKETRKLIDEQRGKVDLSQAVKDRLAGKGIRPETLNPSNPSDAKVIREATQEVEQARIRESRQKGAGVEEEKRETRFANQALRVKDAVQGIDQIITTIDETPEAVGFSGSLAATIVGVADQVGSLAKIVRPDFSTDSVIGEIFDDLDDFSAGILTEEELANRTSQPFRKRLEKVGITAPVLQGQLVGVAISLATLRAVDGRGRLTTDMVNQQLRELTATQTQSPRVLREGILRVRADIIRRLEERERILLQGEVPTFGPPPVSPSPQLRPGDVQVNPEQIQTPPGGQEFPTLNEAQQRAIQEAEEGQEFTLGGQRFIKRGGTLVPAGR